MRNFYLIGNFYAILHAQVNDHIWYPQAYSKVELCFSENEVTRATTSFIWTRGKGQDVTDDEVGSRPNSDHTTGTSSGYYMYADSTNAMFGETTQVIYSLFIY